jgi:hypothetical protein
MFLYFYIHLLLKRYKIIDNITKWIAEEEWQYNILNDLNFHFYCNISVGYIPVLLGIDKKIDRIIIHNYVALSEDMKKSFGLLHISVKHDFWRVILRFYEHRSKYRN